MYMFLNALILAWLVPASAPVEANVASCRAELKGLNLLTMVQLPGGVVIEGPWSVVHRGVVEEGEVHFEMLATLDRIIEKDVVTGRQREVPFPEPVSLAFEGLTQEELIHRAAHVWCVTVMRAQENRALDQLPANRSSITRIVMVPSAQRAS